MKKAEIVENKEDYKDLYANQRCFILGNGPSLNKTDLSCLSDEYTFGCNKISMLYEKRNWHPSFYVMVSSDIWRHDWLLATNKNVEIGIPCFLNKRNRLINTTTENFYKEIADLRNVYLIDAEGGRKGYPYKDSQWSNDPMVLE